MTASALDISRIRAITLDLDDTLWPIWPTIARAEAVLLDWLAEHAPATRALHASTAALRALRDRVQLALSVLAAIAVSTLVKRISSSSCPWDLAEFGGVARYVSHWSWGVWDGGAGHCFPAGHASAGLGFVAGWFVLRRTAAHLAAAWLWTALAVGVLLGLSQQLRGAHYLSHTLWSAWLCWSFGLAVEYAVTARQQQQHSRQPS